MAWRLVQLTESEQQLVRHERFHHPHPGIQRRFEVIWLLHCGQLQAQVCQIAGVSLKTVDRILRDYSERGLDGVRRWDCTGPTSKLQAHAATLEQMFRDHPPRTIAEAAELIEQATGIRRGPTQVRAFLKRLGLKWRRIGAVPIPPKKVWTNMSPIKLSSTPNS